jgi:uncharacterized protein (TIGR03437 family)
MAVFSIESNGMPRATVLEMLKTAALCLAFTGMAATSSGFSLGLDYSVRLTGSDSTVIAAVDDAGSVYLLQTPVASSSAVIKLTPDGGQLAYLKMLGFVATAMDVDSAGSVYVAGPNLVAKLDGRGAGFLYQISITPDCVLTGLAVDNAGHAFVTGYTGATPLATTANAFQPTATAGNSHPFVVKVNAAGTGFDYATYVAGSNGDLAWAIAVNSSGEAFVTGEASSVDFPITPGAFNCTPPAFGGFVPFLARLTADGSSLVYSTFTGGGLSDRPLAVATTLQNSAVVYQQGAGTTTLLRFNPQGTALEFSRTLPASIVYLGSASGMLAVDAIGNTYATGSTTAANFPVKNSLSTCGTSSVYLTVLDPSGNLLQSTYVAGALPDHLGNALALGLNGAVYLTGLADGNFVPTRQIPGVSGDLFLMRLSTSSAPQTVRLACIGNAGSYNAGALAAGEIVSLFGEGLGPAQGVTPTVDDVFPNELAGVAVTFDGMPAPLLYVQDGQVNTVVPWQLTAGAVTTICVSYAGAATNCLARSLSEAAPGLFTSDGLYAAAINQDGTVNSAVNPAPRGSVVSIFATGLGQIMPTPQDGAIMVPPLGTNILPAKIGVTIGGIIFSIVPMDVLYSGPAPFEVAGVSQINLIAVSSPLSVVVGPDFYNPVARSQSFRIHVAEQ